MHRPFATFLAFLLLLPVLTKAEIKAMFHPDEETLVTIAKTLDSATRSIDMALYNIDATENNPVYAYFKSAEFQSKIKGNTEEKLRVRLIYEGYGSEDEKNEKCRRFEELGIDVRSLGAGKKMHHKFAVLDGRSDNPRLITGSANWSLASRNFYHENILFVDQEPALAEAFQAQFDLLWNNAKEFGAVLTEKQQPLSPETPGEDLIPFFNSDNFSFKNGKISKKKDSGGFTLTRQIVSAIDSAEEKIDIATTRINLRPIYNAILRAAERKVKISIVVNLDQYAYKSIRKKMQLGSCPDEFVDSCSSGKNFSHFLNIGEFPGHENIVVRIKFFSLNPSVYLAKQMHSKYLIIDEKTLLTGSFNWSYSAEYSHIENVIKIEGDNYPALIGQYEKNFTRIFEGNRDQYQPYLGKLDNALATGEKTDCSFDWMSLTFEEIDALLDLGKPYHKKLNDACR